MPFYKRVTIVEYKKGLRQLLIVEAKRLKLLKRATPHLTRVLKYSEEINKLGRKIDLEMAELAEISSPIKVKALNDLFTSHPLQSFNDNIDSIKSTLPIKKRVRGRPEMPFRLAALLFYAVNFGQFNKEEIALIGEWLSRNGDLCLYIKTHFGDKIWDDLNIPSTQYEISAKQQITNRWVKPLKNKLTNVAKRHLFKVHRNIKYSSLKSYKDISNEDVYSYYSHYGRLIHRLDLAYWSPKDDPYYEDEDED